MPGPLGIDEGLPRVGLIGQRLEALEALADLVGEVVHAIPERAHENGVVGEPGLGGHRHDIRDPRAEARELQAEHLVRT